MGDLVRIHYQIPADLHRQLKAQAARRGVSLKAIVIEALHRQVYRRST